MDKPGPFDIKFELFNSNEDAVERLVQDVKKCKVSLPDHFNSW